MMGASELVSGKEGGSLGKCLQRKVGWWKAKVQKEIERWLNSLSLIRNGLGGGGGRSGGGGERVEEEKVVWATGLGEDMLAKREERGGV